MVGLKERSSLPQYTDCPSSNKSPSGPAALHYLRHHCSTACIDPPKRIYEVWLPVLRKHENSRANRWTHFAQRLQKIHFPLLQKLQPNKFLTWVAGILFFFLWLWTNKWILDYDLRLSKMCFCNVWPLAWSQHLSGIHCMDIWKLAKRDTKLFKFYILIFSKLFDLWQRRKHFILTMLSL